MYVVGRKNFPPNQLRPKENYYPIINQAFISRDEYEHLDECYLKLDLVSPSCMAWQTDTIYLKKFEGQLLKSTPNKVGRPKSKPTLTQ